MQYTKHKTQHVTHTKTRVTKPAMYNGLALFFGGKEEVDNLAGLVNRKRGVVEVNLQKAPKQFLANKTISNVRL